MYLVTLSTGNFFLFLFTFCYYRSVSSDFERRFVFFFLVLFVSPKWTQLQNHVCFIFRYNAIFTSLFTLLQILFSCILYNFFNENCSHQTYDDKIVDNFHSMQTHSNRWIPFAFPSWTFASTQMTEINHFICFKQIQSLLKS